MEDIEVLVRYMTLKELREMKAIIDRLIAIKERQLELIKQSLT